MNTKQATAPKVDVGRIPAWFSTRLRSAIKREGGRLPRHEWIGMALQRVAPSGLLDHFGASTVNGRRVFVTEPYGGHDLPARAFAAWLGCVVVRAPEAFHNPEGGCVRYEFHEPIGVNDAL